MNIFIKLIAVSITILVAELFLRFGFEKDTDREISEIGTFPNKNVKDSAKLIVKRRQRIATSYTLSYSILVTGAIAITKKSEIGIEHLKVGSIEYGLIGVLLGAIFISLTSLFTEKVKSINFRSEKGRRHGYWKSYLTSPIRCVVYAYNALWILST
jgi:hypothetical protein